MLLLTWLRPGASCPVYIPSSLLRYVAFKLTLDIQELPALQELFKCAGQWVSVCVSCLFM